MAGMRATLAQYREAVRCGNDEKDALVDSIRRLQAELVVERRATADAEQGRLLAERSRDQSSSAARAVSPSSSSNQQHQQQQQRSTNDHDAAATAEAKVRAASTEVAAAAASRHSPERLAKELAIANSKMEHMARELQRVHHDYDAEIRRLHRMIAKLEGQLLEVTTYAYAESASAASATTPGTRFDVTPSVQRQ